VPADLEFCDEQVLRLRAFTAFTRDQAVMREFADSLASKSASNTVARKVIDDLLEYSVSVPTVADIVRMARQASPDMAGPDAAAPVKCTVCLDDGYMPVTRGGYECSEPCQCELGRKIAKGAPVEV